MRIPRYRKRTDRNTAFAEWRGRRYPFPGKFKSKESVDAYERFVRWALRIQREEAGPVAASPNIRVDELVEAFIDFARAYHITDGKPNSEYDLLRLACKPLVRLHGRTAAADFGPLALKEVQSAMISQSWVKPTEKYRPWARSFINYQIRRIRRVFKWGVAQELVQPSVLQALQTVQPVKRGRTEAKEGESVGAVDTKDVLATLHYLTPVTRAMVRLQQLTGMRSGNLVRMRPGDINRTDCVWVYGPRSHKSAWRGRSLVITLGPRAQEVLRPFLDRPDDAYCFSPRESEQHRKAALREKRKTRVQPSQVSRAKPHPKRHAGERYTVESYRNAIKYAIKQARKAGVDVSNWTPHQLRHAAATLVRKRRGIEAAQAYLGHAHADTTQIYAESSVEAAKAVALELG